MFLIMSCMIKDFPASVASHVPEMLNPEVIPDRAAGGGKMMQKRNAEYIESSPDSFRGRTKNQEPRYKSKDVINNKFQKMLIFHIFFAYSIIEQSDEKFPMCAAVSIDIVVHLSRSRYA